MGRLSGHRIMVVEDQFYLARDVQRALAEAGAAIAGPYPGLDDAVEALMARAPDCAILDVNLGEGASFELADRLCSEGVPFLFFTGYDAEVIPPRFADVPRLQKPVDQTRLIDAAELLCGTKSLGST
jgi:CheY-like chemotaxis protein